MVVDRCSGKLIEMFLFHVLFSLSLEFSSMLNWFATVLQQCLYFRCHFPHLSILRHIPTCCLSLKFVLVQFCLLSCCSWKSSHSVSINMLHRQCPTMNMLLPQRLMVKMSPSNQSITQHHAGKLCGTQSPCFYSLQKQMLSVVIIWVWTHNALQTVLFNEFSRNRVTPSRFRKLL